MDDIEKVRESIDIVEFIRQHTPLQQTGKNFKGACPLHGEKTPSFFVRPERGLWYCFGCQKGGDVFTFLMEKEHLTFGEALQILAQKAGVTLSGRGGKQNIEKKERLFSLMTYAVEYYQEQLRQASKAQEYLNKRGVTQEMIGVFNLGYAPDDWHSVSLELQKRGFGQTELEEAGMVIVNTKAQGGVYDRFRNRIMFPVYDHLGRVCGFSGRTLGSEKEAKYINSPETTLFKKGSLLYGYDKAQEVAREKDFTILVEGNLDVISLYSQGVQNVVAPLGTGLTERQLTLLKRISERLLIVFDADEAGKSAAKRALGEAVVQGFEVKVATLTQAKDPDEAIRSDKKQFIRDLKNAKPGFRYLLDLSLAAYDANSGYGKKQISEESFAHVSLVPDNIVQNSHLELLASELNISPKVVNRDFVSWTTKHQATSVFSKSSDEQPNHYVVGEKSPQEMLEDYFIALIFNVSEQVLKYFFQRDRVLELNSEGFFTQEWLSDLWQKIVDSFRGEGGSLTGVIQSLAELEQKKLDQIILRDFGTVLNDEDVAKKELLRVFDKLAQSYYKNAIKEATRQKEQLSSGEEIDLVNRRIKEFTQRLRNL